jgi:two-component system LytT family response regulator
MKQVPVVIVEDEIRNQKLLTHLIEKNCPELEIVGYAKGVNEAIDQILEKQPILIFLDIQLIDGSGFEVLNSIKESDRPRVIFTTAFDEYALKAFKYSAVNYLLKPIDKQELMTSVEKVLLMKELEEMASVTTLVNQMLSRNEDQMISISGIKSTEYLKISEIVHIEAMGAYSQIHLKNNTTHVVSKVIKVYDQMLAGHEFFRVHQSHLINLRSVRKFNRGDSTVILENDAEISIARNRKDSFLTAMDKMIF